MMPQGCQENVKPEKTRNPKQYQMTKKRKLMRSTLGTILSIGLACLTWEAFARSGLFAPALAPSIVLISSAFGRMVLSGAMLWHALYTLYRVLFGFLLAS